MRGRRLFIHVQHLLGIGHLQRAAIVARACAERGMEVLLASGGKPWDGLDTGAAQLLQLSPARAADAHFRALVDADGAAVDEAWRIRRRDELLDAFSAFRPDVLVIETFPFGRRLLRFELMPLIDAAWAQRPRPRIVSSVRDILAAKRKAGRNEEAAALIEERFDRVLVHGDPSFVTLQRSFPLADRIAGRIAYSGYVAEKLPAPGHDGPGRGEVVVSAGGSDVGLALLRTALAARAHTRFSRSPWRVLASDSIDEADFRALRAEAPAGILVERARPDFPSLIANCALSVSQAGYNTVMALLQSAAPTVLVPFSRGGETEQSLRAELLAARGIAETVAEPELDPRTLAAAIERAAGRERTGAPDMDLGGAQASARLLGDWAVGAAA